ncbi:MAG: hypothetical protein JSW09_09015 [Pseudomonadota bacterium]|nr:MAG: hypothetical protein JSW09_09015 [Pseudomonadota bacterium]
MIFRYFAAFIAAALLISYAGPIVLKLREFSLAAVVLIGVAMMLVDLWQSLKTKGE